MQYTPSPDFIRSLDRRARVSVPQRNFKLADDDSAVNCPRWLVAVAVAALAVLVWGIGR